MWVDWMKDPVACIALDVDGTLVAISHGAEVTVVEQPTICGCLHVPLPSKWV